MVASLLFLATVGLIIPALFHVTVADHGFTVERRISITTSFVLLDIYDTFLLFSLKTYRYLFAGKPIRHRSWVDNHRLVVFRSRYSLW